MSEEEPHPSPDDARAGTTPHMTRVVLAFSMLLIVGIFVVLYLFWSR